MEPIQLQCGSCGQVMGISPEHQGSQVQCPHCKAIVQTPPAAPSGFVSLPSGVTPLGGAFDAAGMEAREQESIFAPPEATDDLFESDPAPRVQMPPEPPREHQPLPYGRADDVSPTAVTVTMEAAPRQPLPPPSAPSFPDPSAGSPGEELADIPASRRVVEQGGLFGTILLIFLVPYAMFTTAFIGYLLYTWPRDNPLKMLRDDAPKGQPRQQVKHNLPLDKDMKTVLGQPIRVGAIEVTPLKVKHTPAGDLVLVFRAKNVSTDLVFNPISHDYMKYSGKESMDAAKPYTFLERVPGEKLKKIYGGHLDWYKGPAGAERALDLEIGPGEEAIIHLTSDMQYRKLDVPNVLKAPERLVWRVQVRRGLVPVEDKMVSATTVIGVEFNAREIVREKEDVDG